jgi:hypothetical protein
MLLSSWWIYARGRGVLRLIRVSRPTLPQALAFLLVGSIVAWFVYLLHTHRCGVCVAVEPPLTRSHARTHTREYEGRERERERERERDGERWREIYGERMRE